MKAQYQLGINFKAEFINTTLDKIGGKNLLYIDTDMRIENYPHLCDLDVDFMGYNWFNEVRDQQKFVSYEESAPFYNPISMTVSGGILFFSQSKGSRHLANLWAHECKLYPW